MSETTPTYAPASCAATLRAAEAAAQSRIDRSLRLFHLGELALAWAVAQRAWEDAPRADLVAVGLAWQAAAVAEQHLRAACMVALVHEAQP